MPGTVVRGCILPLLPPEGNREMPSICTLNSTEADNSILYRKILSFVSRLSIRTAVLGTFFKNYSNKIYLIYRGRLEGNIK